MTEYFAGQLLTAGVLNAGQPITAFRDADASPLSSTTTLVTDSMLTALLEANATYDLELRLIWQCVSATPKIKMDLSLPSGASKEWSAYTLGSSITSNPGSIDVGTTSGQHVRATVAGTLTALCKGVITMAGTAGICAVQYAPNVSSADALTIKANSRLTLIRLA